MDYVPSSDESYQRLCELISLRHIIIAEIHKRRFMPDDEKITSRRINLAIKQYLDFYQSQQSVINSFFNDLVANTVEMDMQLLRLSLPQNMEEDFISDEILERFFLRKGS